MRPPEGERDQVDRAYEAGAASLTTEACHRAIRARDARFDGVFVVGVASTQVFCRPSCPSRPACRPHRRFFRSADAAGAAGFRACLRCRPEVPGYSPTRHAEALGAAVVRRILDGALDGGRLRDLASEREVSERHLRRCVKMVVGTTPTELAITRRLVAARDLLTKSELGISRVAYASGFQSLRRFNATFQERWGTTPRRVRSIGAAIAGRVPPLVLRLSYRGALAWDGLRRRLLSGAMPGTACMSGERYAATVRLEGCAGHVVAGHDARQERIDVRVSADLVHAVVPLVRRLRRLFDLDADVSSIDRDLTLGGLGAFVPLEPGVRLAGTLDPFGAALTCLVTRNSRAGSSGRATLLSLTHAFGESLETDIPGLDCLPLAPERIAEAGVGGLERLGMPASTASAVHRVALLFAESLAP